jgi:hypothetical protein
MPTAFSFSLARRAYWHRVERRSDAAVNAFIEDLGEGRDALAVRPSFLVA